MTFSPSHLLASALKTAVLAAVAVSFTAGTAMAARTAAPPKAQQPPVVKPPKLPIKVTPPCRRNGGSSVSGC